VNLYCLPRRMLRAVDQFRTQGLNMTEQLQTGVRFIDFRIQYTAGPYASTRLIGLCVCLNMDVCGSTGLFGDRFHGI
jgi:hypothetical protein